MSTSLKGAILASGLILVFQPALAATPRISNVSDRSINEGDITSAAFTVSDRDTQVSALKLSGSSSGEILVPKQNIVFQGTDRNRSVTVTPAPGKSGTATITLTVSDGSASASDSFVLTVNPANDAPTISAIPDQTINEDGSTGNLAFTVGDDESEPTQLTVSTSSSNASLVPNGNILLSGTGAERMVKVVPNADQSGTATITVTVSDGSAATSTTFNVTVYAVNDPPLLSGLSDMTIAGNTAGGPFPFSIEDKESAASVLTLSATSSNTNLVPTGNIKLAGSGSIRTVTITPAHDQAGTAAIDIKVSDGSSTTSGAFRVTVTEPLAEAPTGIYCSCTQTRSDGSSSYAAAIADLPFVRGFLVRVSWKDIELTDDQFVWDLLDGQIAKISAKNKKIALAIVNGPSAPAWLYDANHNASSATSSDGKKMPIPWDEAYLSEWKEFIGKLGARYGNEQTITLVHATHSTGNGFEMQLPKQLNNTTWANEGYSATRLIDSWNQVVDAFAAAFPNTPIDVEVHEDIDNGSAVPQGVWDYASAIYGPRFGLFGAWWTPYNADSNSFDTVYNLLQDATVASYGMVQFAGSATNTPDRMLEGGGKTNEGNTYTPEEAFVATGDLAIQSGVKYMEIWNSDLTNPDLKATLQYYDSLLQ